jgi:hypothetical protein
MLSAASLSRLGCATLRRGTLCVARSLTSTPRVRPLSTFAPAKCATDACAWLRCSGVLSPVSRFNPVRGYSSACADYTVAPRCLLLLFVHVTAWASRNSSTPQRSRARQECTVNVDGIAEGAVQRCNHQNVLGDQNLPEKSSGAV